MLDPYRTPPSRHDRDPLGKLYRDMIPSLVSEDRHHDTGNENASVHEEVEREEDKQYQPKTTCSEKGTEEREKREEITRRLIMNACERE